MNPLVLKWLGGALAVVLVGASALYWHNGKLREEVGEERAACTAKMEQLGRKHDAALAAARLEEVEAQAARIQALREALVKERLRRTELLQRNEELQADFNDALDALDSPEEQQWKEQDIPESILALGSPSS